MERDTTQECLKRLGKETMSPELEKKLLDKYPELYNYKSGDGKSSEISYYGFSHGDGWFNIIDCLSATITDIMRSHPARKHLTRNEFRDQVQVKAAQVKEKFGQLRVYIKGSAEQRAVVDMACDLSVRICEVCGNKGYLCFEDWVQTLCVTHMDEAFGSGYSSNRAEQLAADSIARELLDMASDE